MCLQALKPNPRKMTQSKSEPDLSLPVPRPTYLADPLKKNPLTIKSAAQSPPAYAAR